MTAPGNSDQGDLSTPADAQSKKVMHLTWVAVVLTMAVAFVRSGDNPTFAWIFVVMALLSAGCSLVALARAKRTEAGQRNLSPVVTLCLSVGDFLTYVDLQTGESKPWIYERVSASNCTTKSAPYQNDGRQQVLVLRGKGGVVERADEDVK